MDLILLLKAFLLGIVEGATEFLPVSSTGHLIIVTDLIGFMEEQKRSVFEIVIQLGAIFAVCWEYRSRLIHVAMGVTSERASQRFLLNLFIGFLPAAVLGLMFHHYIKTYLFSPLTVAIALIVGGFVIIFIENKYSAPDAPEHKTATLDELTSLQALQVGFAQSLAMMPGVSRSGATILGGMVFGLSRKAATEFSFFLAIPVMLAATGYDLYKNWALLSSADLPIFIVGFLMAFIAALVAVRTLLHYVANHDFKPFAYYRIVFGIIVLLLIYYRPSL